MDVGQGLLTFGFQPQYLLPLRSRGMMIEPTENESKETIDAFIAVMRQIAQEAAEQPELVKTAPHNTPIKRVDDVAAARQPILTYKGDED
jgi:glycine dehydrogenase subunit 2